MKLIEVSVNLFRNIIDCSPVIIEPDVTCLVGKNESGKTAFLHALYRLNPARSNVTFSVHDQYPAWLEKRDRLKGTDLEKVKVVHAKFAIGEKEQTEIEDIFGTGIFVSNELTLSKDYSGTLYHTLNINEKAAIDHFISKVSIPQSLSTEGKNSKSITDLFDFISRACSRENVSKDAKEALRGLEGDLKEIINDKGLNDSIYDKLIDSLPKFFYFDKYSTLPYSVDIHHLLKSSEENLDDEELTARSLLRLAAADDDYLMNPDYERRKRELENMANALTDDVLKYWSQNPSLRVLPDISQRTEKTAQGEQSVLHEIKFRIWDDRHSLSLPFSEHSSGFQWFFSFLAAFSEYEFKETPVIILLDEPALGLHARAQKDFLRFIEERLAPKCQVLHTTHSPFMVEPSKLERIRIVEDRGREEGMKVSQDVLTTDPDTLFPLQGALGYDMAQHLFIAPHNLVVEGTSDYTYLTVFSDYLRENGNRTCLDDRWSIVPVGGADLIPTFVALLGHHLDVTVLIDSRKTGHQRLSNLVADGYLSQTRIVSVGEVLKKRQADIEDLFAVEDYLLLFNRAFSKNISESEIEGTPTIVSQIAHHQNISRFDHGKPADLLLRERDQLLPMMKEKTFRNFEQLFDRLNSTLK